jgi:hypothetical protein
MLTTTRHTFLVTIERSDRDEPLAAGTIDIDGEDYHAFDASAARALLISSGRLTLGTEWVTFDDTIVPARFVDRVRVQLVAASRPG